MSTLKVAFYGKIASAPDFVRINAGAFAQAGWDAWFQEGMAHLQRQALPLPSQPVCFVMSTQGRLCAGAFAPGRDALARSFPAIVSIETPAPPVAELAPWRQLREPFFAAAGLLALHASQLTLSEIAARVSSVESRLEGLALPPIPSEALAASSLAELTDGQDLADIAYGLTSAIAACADTRAAGPGLPTRVLTLYGQATTEPQRSFWIELVGRHLNHALPSLLWSEQTLVMALGQPPPAALACLLNPGPASSRFWPLHTSNPAARAAAVARLSPVQAHVLASPTTSLAHVLAVFAREPR